MKTASIFGKLNSSLAQFRSAQGGNVAVIFAIAIVPIIGFVGAAIDYSRANNARTAMQAALDSTTLMLSKDVTGLTATDVTKKAQDYFAALYKSNDAKGVAVTAAYTTTGTGSKIVMNASANITTSFMKVVGFPTLGFGTSSTAVWGNSRMRVAMVLDNTGSMADNGKMAAMQTAAKNMITTLSGYNKTDGDVYVSIVPFAKDVNVGTSNVNATWLNWSEWEAEPPIINDPTEKSLISVKYNNITYKWGDIGPGAPCPFDVTNNGGSPPSNTGTPNKYGFACMDSPPTSVSSAKDLSSVSPNRYLIPSSGAYAGMICPGMDNGTNFPGKTGIYYNGCYTSVANPPTVVSGPSSSASCPSGTPNCTCTGTGNNKTCSRITYQHPWRTHPSDTAQAAAAAPLHSKWTGCVNDRDQNFDTTNTAPIANDVTTPSTRYYAEQWTDCLASTVTGMSNNWAALKTQIDNMTPNGNTNQSVGFAWGWQTLNTVNAPFKAPPKGTDSAYTDYVVLLSDGLNTQNRWYTCPANGPCPTIDAREATLCENIKGPSSNVTVFTIQVNIGNKDPQSTVLKNCATGSNFQMVTSATQTADAFQNILIQISKLRIAK